MYFPDLCGNNFRLGSQTCQCEAVTGGGLERDERVVAWEKTPDRRTVPARWEQVADTLIFATSLFLPRGLSLSIHRTQERLKMGPQPIGTIQLLEIG